VSKHRPFHIFFLHVAIPHALAITQPASTETEEVEEVAINSGFYGSG